MERNKDKFLVLQEDFEYICKQESIFLEERRQIEELAFANELYDYLAPAIIETDLLITEKLPF